MYDSVEILNETGRWRARPVRYWRGSWDQLRPYLPTFAIEHFANGGPANPYLKSVVRLPLTSAELPIPVGVVSKRYSLAQHYEVAEKCFEGIRNSGIEPSGLRCEIGLTELGEWMNFRVYLPADFDFKASDGPKLSLRFECFNSVDGSSRLVLLFGWLRLVCTNGLVIRETKVEMTDTHDEFLDLDEIPRVVTYSLQQVPTDVARLERWQSTPVNKGNFVEWLNEKLSKRWGKKAACRVFHICESGWDVRFPLPFAGGVATEKPVEKAMEVPGARTPARNLYDVSQALSWIATRRPNTEERREWQVQIPNLIESLSKQPASSNPARNLFS